MHCLTAVRNLDYPGDEELGVAGGASKIYVNLCQKKDCQDHACYCCPEEAPAVCYLTMDVCRQNCPSNVPVPHHGLYRLVAPPVAGG
jgi:hypothetical protein